ncbi:hypothetical protein D3C76_1679520 [compost metagenome]
MDHAVVAYGRDGYTGRVQLAGIGFTFITQDVGLGGLYQRGRQALELCGAGA